MSCLRRRGRIRHSAGVQTRFVDCRPRAEYLAGHLPGAAWADAERDLTGGEGGGRHPLPGADSFAAWASRAGIGRGTLVVAYDSGSGWAARLWWLLRHFGHDDAGVLSFDAWHGPLREGPEAHEAQEFVPRPRRDDVASAEELVARLGDPRLVLVDARAPERWRGDVEPLDPVAGRIPGARNLPYTQAFPPPAELLEAEELVVYCGSGVTACVDALALTLAGRPDVRLYPGSWSEWCHRGLPLERGGPAAAGAGRSR
jgi:thiosulfate/3-mercaptopyruvate sulfurtransferase